MEGPPGRDRSSAIVAAPYPTNKPTSGIEMPNGAHARSAEGHEWRLGRLQSASVVARGPQTGLYAPRGTPPAVLAGLPKQERQGGA